MRGGTALTGDGTAGKRVWTVEVNAIPALVITSTASSADAYDIHAYGGRDGDIDPYDEGDWSFGVFETTIGIIGLAYMRYSHSGAFTNADLKPWQRRASFSEITA